MQCSLSSVWLCNSDDKHSNDYCVSDGWIEEEEEEEKKEEEDEKEEEEEKEEKEEVLNFYRTSI